MNIDLVCIYNHNNVQVPHLAPDSFSGLRCRSIDKIIKPDKRGNFFPVIISKINDLKPLHSEIFICCGKRTTPPGGQYRYYRGKDQRLRKWPGSRESGGGR